MTENSYIQLIIHNVFKYIYKHQHRSAYSTHMNTCHGTKIIILNSKILYIWNNFHIYMKKKKKNHTWDVHNLVQFGGKLEIQSWLKKKYMSYDPFTEPYVLTAHIFVTIELRRKRKTTGQ